MASTKLKQKAWGNTSCRSKRTGTRIVTLSFPSSASPRPRARLFPRRAESLSFLFNVYYASAYAFDAGNYATWACSSSRPRRVASFPHPMFWKSASPAGLLREEAKRGSFKNRKENPPVSRLGPDLASKSDLSELSSNIYPAAPPPLRGPVLSFSLLFADRAGTSGTISSRGSR